MPLFCLQVADFGLAQWTGEDGETALTDTVTNRLWLAPEVLHSPEQTGNGSFVVSKAADVYSFGCIMYEVLTGRLPFETDSVHQTMLEVVSMGAVSFCVTTVLCCNNSRCTLFGCIMFEVLTGQQPFKTDSVHQTMLEVVSISALLFTLQWCYVIPTAAARYLVHVEGDSTIKCTYSLQWQRQRQLCSQQGC
jgi:serine/threonine protein kinase